MPPPPLFRLYPPTSPPRPSSRGSSSQGSGEEGEPRLSVGSGSTNKTRRRSSVQSYRTTSRRRASAELARKAYATMHTMHSRVDEDSSTRRRTSMSGAADSGGGGGAGGVRYYLRRGSLQQVAAKTRRILTGAVASGENNSDSEGNGGEVIRKRRAASSAHPQKPTRSRGAGGGDGGVSFYLRRASLQGLPRIERILSGSAKAEYSDPADDMARDMAIAVAAAEAAVAGTPASPAAPEADATAGSREASVGRQDNARTSISGLDEQRDLDRVEAGRGHPTIRDINVGKNSSGDGPTRGRGGGEVQGEGAGQKGDGPKTVSARKLGTHDDAEDTQGPAGDNVDVESGMRCRQRRVLSLKGEGTEINVHMKTDAGALAESFQASEDLWGGADSSANLIKHMYARRHPCTIQPLRAPSFVRLCPCCFWIRVGGPPPTTLPGMGQGAGCEESSRQRPQPGAEAAGAGATPLNVPAGARHSTVGEYTEASRVRAEDTRVDAGSDDGGASLLAPQRPAGGGLGVRDSATMVDSGGEPLSSARSHGRSAEAVATAGPAEEGCTNKAPSADGKDCIAVGSAAPEEQPPTQPRSNLEGGVSCRGDDRSSMQQQQQLQRQQSLSSNGIGVEGSYDKSVAAATPLDNLRGVAAVAPPPDGASDVRNTSPGRRNDASSARDALRGSETAVERQDPAEIDTAKADIPPTVELSAAPAPLVAVDAGTTKQVALKSAKRKNEGAFVPQEREVVAEALSVGSMPSSAVEGREDASRGSAAADNAGAVMSGEEETSARRGSERSGERKGGHKSRKHRHKHKHKHKRSHRHRDGDSDGGGGVGKTRRRRSKDHALAPLKRIPPPSLSYAQKSASVASEGDEAGDGSFGGGG